MEIRKVVTVVEDDPRDANFEPLQANYRRLLEMTDQDGRPLRAYYHSTCGGHTTDVPTGLDREPSPAMKGVPCPYCEGARYWRWSATLDSAPILKAAALEGPLEKFEVGETGPGGRANTIRVAAGGHEKVLKANAFRLAIGASALRSTYLLAVARERCRVHPNVRFVNEDARKLPFADQTFECVVSYGDVLSHIVDGYEQALSEISRVSRPGALISFEVDNKWNAGMLYKRRELWDALRTRGRGHDTRA